MNDKPTTVRFGWRHQYDDARDAHERAKTDYVETSESLTEQHHTPDTDINVLVARFGITDGSIRPAVHDPSYYGDFSDEVSFREALDRVRTATENFNQLPADLRSKFDNKPAKLYAFVSDPANIEESIKLGLLRRNVPRETPPADDKLTET